MLGMTPRALQAFVAVTTLAACQALFAQQPPARADAPPPPRLIIDPSLEPEVRIIERGTDKVEEFRVNGRLYMIRITPAGGTPYVLVDETGDGKFATPAQGPAEAHRLAVPMWVIKSF